MKLKMIKIGLVIATILGIGVLSFLVPYKNQQNVADGYVDKSEIIPEEKVPEVEDEVDEEEPVKQEIQAEEKKEVEEFKGKEEPEKKEEFQNTEVIEHKKEMNNKKVVEDTEAVPVDTSIQEVPTVEDEIVPIVLEEESREDWVEAKIEEYRDEIAEGDIADFRHIIGKLDMNYAMGLLDKENGETHLKAYMRAKLTAQEYERSKELFLLYNYIIFE